MNINVGDIVEFKKAHPCGETKWEVLRTGADLRLKCLKCQHQIMYNRHQAEKKIKSIIPRE